MEFFEEVPQHPATVAGHEVVTPAFYYDYSQVAAVWVTPLERIRELLPSGRLHPLRLTPRRGVTVIAAYQYRDSTLGPYNEVAVGFPVTVDKQVPVLAGLGRFQTRGGSIFIWQLPVTTEIARDLGVETAGYPKFLADIAIQAEGGLAACRLAEGGRLILTLRLRYRKPRVRPPRVRYEPVTVKGDRLVRSAWITNTARAAQSFSGRGVELELGDHPLADQLRRLELGRVLLASYAPVVQSVLSPPLESWPLG